VLSRAWVEELRTQLPELPDARRARYIAEYDLSAQDVNVLTEDKPLGDYFEQVMAASHVADRKARARTASNWVLSEVARLLKARNVASDARPLSPAALADLLDLLDKQRITGTQAKEVLDEAFATGAMPRAIVISKGIKPPISDQDELERIVEEVISNNAKIANDYRAGKTNAIQALVGQIMKQTRGQARADIVQKLLKAKLDGAPSA
jgi:aspartyl-tRNA(Asn)/glutamyl-tRNA(Gln) amidotransferase subunit B